MKKILFWLFAAFYTVFTCSFMILGFIYQMISFEFDIGRRNQRKFTAWLNKIYHQLYDRKP